MLTKFKLPDGEKSRQGRSNVWIAVRCPWIRRRPFLKVKCSLSDEGRKEYYIFLTNNAGRSTSGRLEKASMTLDHVELD